MRNDVICISTPKGKSRQAGFISIIIIVVSYYYDAVYFARSDLKLGAPRQSLLNKHFPGRALALTASELLQFAGGRRIALARHPFHFASAVVLQLNFLPVYSCDDRITTSFNQSRSLLPIT